MSLYFSTESLRKLLSLSEQRDAILEQLNSLEARISSALTGSPTTTAVKKGRPATAQTSKSGKPERKHGAVKELILSALKEAGDAGIGVKELSKKLGLKNASVHVWFGTTGKAIKEIEKTGKGIYRFITGGSAAPTKVKASAKTQTKAKAKPAKKAAKPKLEKAKKTAVKKAPKTAKAKKGKPTTVKTDAPF